MGGKIVQLALMTAITMGTAGTLIFHFAEHALTAKDFLYGVVRERKSFPLNLP